MGNEIDKRALMLVQQAEEKMDDLNGALGNMGTLCLFCHSSKYDNQGIIHKKECLITKLREWIKFALK